MKIVNFFTVLALFCLFLPAFADFNPLTSLPAWENTILKTKRGIKSSLGDGIFGDRKLRIIGEVVAPIDETEENNQYQELEYFRTLGYDAALLVWYGENMDGLAKVAQQLKKNGWALGFVYSPSSGDVAEFFGQDPANFAKEISKIASYCDFFMLTWRDTNVQHWNVKSPTPLTKRRSPGVQFGMSPTVYAAAVSSVFEGLKDNALIIGDATIPLLNSSGETSGGDREFKIIDAGSSISVVDSIGRENVNPAAIAKKMPAGKRYIPIVFWPFPYYLHPDTVQKMTGTLPPSVEPAKVRQMCKQIEDDFLSADAYCGTITLAGDGYGALVYKLPSEDVLTKSGWRHGKFKSSDLGRDK